MKFTSRDLSFIVATLLVGLLAGFAERALLISRDGAVPPLLLIFLGMALIELAAGHIARTPLGQFVAMPVRLVALAAAFGAYLLVVSL